MTSSSSRDAGRPTPAYARFIPREELGSFASWTPGNFGGPSPQRHPGLAGTPAPAAPAAPAAPSEAEWLARVEAARREGTQQGYQNGYRDGLAALDSFKQSLAQQSGAQVAALLQSIEREFDALQPQLAQSVARVAVELARQVLRHELQVQPEVVNGVAQQALQALVHSASHIQLQLHPQDVALVREGSAEQLAARKANLLANPALERGDCLIESSLGTLDARIATRWAQATSQLAQSAPWQAAPEARPEPGATGEAA